jgi:hypothetical protein
VSDQTCARYYTPSGRAVHTRRLRPTTTLIRARGQRVNDHCQPQSLMSRWRRDRRTRSTYTRRSYSPPRRTPSPPTITDPRSTIDQPTSNITQRRLSATISGDHHFFPNVTIVALQSVNCCVCLQPAGLCERHSRIDRVCIAKSPRLRHKASAATLSALGSAFACDE